ncbi:phospholipase [Hydrogenophaga crocea]|uniref:Phospholipase n=1 Tax=Hydrogenophaga crocea TaxID=2716225 RepID=A0A6G8IFW8_9BURK|nr:phospholipase [Hydrogenophaga crocea]QIM52009.1 phospholipase [Hydrogenophaga crocea]
MRALRLYAGPLALQHLRDHGLRPDHVGVIPAAAGGPKGLILGPIDRLLFGHWLRDAPQTIHLIGASIGAWRMGTACLRDPVAALERLEHDYIHQHFELPPGQRRLTAQQVSEAFSANLQAFYGGRVDEVLQHPRWRLHIVTSRGLRLLARDGRWRTPLGYMGAFAANALHRRALGGWMERVVFSAPDAPLGGVSALPFGTQDLRTRQIPLGPGNFMPAMQASCSIPFVLRPVADIPGAPQGTYWDGGITDYHLHLRYHARPEAPIVLYPHFQKAVVPGWLDKAWKRRHRSSDALDHMLVLAPDPAWVRTLPNGKLPDRTDFQRYGQDLGARVAVWQAAVKAAQQLADELGEWLARPDPSRVEAL